MNPYILWGFLISFLIQAAYLWPYLSFFIAASADLFTFLFLLLYVLFLWSTFSGAVNRFWKFDLSYKRISL